MRRRGGGGVGGSGGCGGGVSRSDRRVCVVCRVCGNGVCVCVWVCVCAFFSGPRRASEGAIVPERDRFGPAGSCVHLASLVCVLCWRRKMALAINNSTLTALQEGGRMNWIAWDLRERDCDERLEREKSEKQRFLELPQK